MVRQFRSAGAQLAGRLMEGKGGIPGLLLCPLVMFQLARAGPSTCKHFPGLAAPLFSKSTNKSQVWRLLVILRLPAGSREPPGPGQPSIQVPAQGGPVPRRRQPGS